MKLNSFAGIGLIGGISFVFLALGALGGCSAIEVGLGLRMRLDKVPVSAVSATLSPDPGLAPGKPKRLIITATTSDGKQLVTVGAGRGKAMGAPAEFAPPRLGEGAEKLLGSSLARLEKKFDAAWNKLAAREFSGGTEAVRTRLELHQ
jgi:hypothetical protein